LSNESPISLYIAIVFVVVFIWLLVKYWYIVLTVAVLAVLTILAYFWIKRRNKNSDTEVSEHSEYIEPETIVKPKHDPEYYERLGADFEDYVENMFDISTFQQTHKTPRKDENGNLDHDCIYPDLRFYEKNTQTAFWVECKWRRGFEEKSKLRWCEKYQLERYKRIRKETGTKTYIMVGVGGKPSNPWKIYCFNLDELRYIELYYGFCKDHEVSNRCFVSMDDIEKYSVVSA